MTPPPPFPAIDRPGALALNAAHEAETAPLDAPALERLLAAAVLARAPRGAAGETLALLIVLDETAGAESPNFRWFAARRARFLYVDRVIVAPAARRTGLARRLYAEALGFAEAGRAPLPSGKTVRYVERAP